MRGDAVNPVGTRRLVQRRRRVTGVEGDFGFEHKGRRGGVTVVGKGSGVGGWGGMMNQISLLLCKCY